MSVNLTDTDEFTPLLHVLSGCGNMEATKDFVERDATLNNVKHMVLIH
jgi:hypothetical protein